MAFLFIICLFTKFRLPALKEGLQGRYGYCIYHCFLFISLYPAFLRHEDPKWLTISFLPPPPVYPHYNNLARLVRLGAWDWPRYPGSSHCKLGIQTTEIHYTTLAHELFKFTQKWHMEKAWATASLYVPQKSISPYPSTSISMCARCVYFVPLDICKGLNPIALRKIP